MVSTIYFILASDNQICQPDAAERKGKKDCVYLYLFEEDIVAAAGPTLQEVLVRQSAGGPDKNAQE